jgi:MFS family permease
VTGAGTSSNVRPALPSYTRGWRPHLSRSAVLALLVGANTLNFFDRQVLSAVVEPVRREWALSDTELGGLVTAFTLLYAFVGLPFGRIADTRSRKWLLAGGLALWSVLTGVSGLCRTYWALFAARLGVGIGEATCAPAATSILGDLFYPQERARAMSVFMAGLPAGTFLSYLAGGFLAQSFGWRSAFLVAAIPGLIIAALISLIDEPARGAAEVRNVGTARRSGSPYLVVLSTPTMWPIIISGAMHNFAMYALSTFLAAFLIRYHGASTQEAGIVSAVVIGMVGALGMLSGGWLGDVLFKRFGNGRLIVAAISTGLSAPAMWLALQQPRGAVLRFALFQGIACLLLYTYYATVYSTIHDIIEPALRGTAMAIYFLAMYVLGGALGPLAAGWVSDLMAGRAARQLGLGTQISEGARALGLHQAMYVVPATGVLLSAVLVAACVTARKDVAAMHRWSEASGSR